MMCRIWNVSVVGIPTPNRSDLSQFGAWSFNGKVIERTAALLLHGLGLGVRTAKDFTGYASCKCFDPPRTISCLSGKDETEWCVAGYPLMSPPSKILRDSTSIVSPYLISVIDHPSELDVERTTLIR